MQTTSSMSNILVYSNFKSTNFWRKNKSIENSLFFP